MKRITILAVTAAAFLFVLLIVAGIAETVDGRSIRVIDGDTVKLESGEVIRLLDIDTPELRNYSCQAEKAAAVRAKARLADLLAGRGVDVRRNGEVDRYGRSLARLHSDIGDIGTILLAERHALIWRPGRQAWKDRKAHWCGR